MKNRSIKRQLVGIVVSNKMDKTAVVQVQKLTKHPLYKKYIKRCNKFAAHDINNLCSIGDKVLIIESKPISKTKKWRVSRILEKAI